MQFTDTSEKAFQKLLTAYLVNNNHYLEGTPQEYDHEFCVNKDQLLQFIQETQPLSFDVIQKKGERNFLSRLDEKISQLGIIEVLRKGIKYYDKTIELFYNKPVSIYNPRDIARYNKNIFSVTQELKYSLSNENRLDLVIFINGLPISTFELKNAFTNQAVKNAIRQYQTDRDPKEKLFSFARCVVHFAADTDLVYMTTHLKGKQTDFLPFNKGFNNGAGNPVNPDGLKTHYL
jgi:type I restriction enzyme, R subunit